MENLNEVIANMAAMKQAHRARKEAAKAEIEAVKNSIAEAKSDKAAAAADGDRDAYAVAERNEAYCAARLAALLKATVAPMFATKDEAGAIVKTYDEAYAAARLPIYERLAVALDTVSAAISELRAIDAACSETVIGIDEDCRAAGWSISWPVEPRVFKNGTLSEIRAFVGSMVNK